MYTLPSSSLATLAHCPNWDRRIPSFVEVRNEVLKANKFCDQQLATTAARNEFSRATARAAARDRQRSVSETLEGAYYGGGWGWRGHH